MMKPRFLSLLLLTLLAACASGSGNLLIHNAWIRPADAGMNTAAYFVIESTGEEDRLLSVESRLAESTEIHRSYVDEAGVMRMQEQAFVIIPADGSISFEPGGLHIMFIELNRDLVLDEQIQLQLHFEKQGEITIDVPVEIP